MKKERHTKGKQQRRNKQQNNKNKNKKNTHWGAAPGGAGEAAEAGEGRAGRAAARLPRSQLPKSMFATQTLSSTIRAGPQQASAPVQAYSAWEYTPPAALRRAYGASSQVRERTARQALSLACGAGFCGAEVGPPTLRQLGDLRVLRGTALWR